MFLLQLKEEQRYFYLFQFIYYYQKKFDKQFEYLISNSESFEDFSIINDENKKYALKDLLKEINFHHFLKYTYKNKNPNLKVFVMNLLD